MKLSKLSNQTNSQDPQAVNSRIFVGNLNTFQCSKTDVERMFQIYGRLAGISMHKGYAFVQFTNPFDARNACHGEDSKTVLSQTLDVNMVAEPKAHQIGRKRQNVSKTGNDWDYFYDSYCSSALLRGGGGGVNGVRAKKRKRLMTNGGGMAAAVQQQQLPGHGHHSVAAVAAAVHQQQQQAAQQQQAQQQAQQQQAAAAQQQHQQQVAAVAMAAMANLLPQQQLLLHQQNLLSNVATTASAAPGSLHWSQYKQEQQLPLAHHPHPHPHPHQHPQQFGFQLKSSVAVQSTTLPQNAKSAIIANQTALGEPYPVGGSFHQQQQQQQQQHQQPLLQPLTLALSPQQPQPHQAATPLQLHSQLMQQHQQQQQQQQQQQHQQQQHQQQQQQHQAQEQLSLHQQWGPFKVYSNPDTLICGNCRESFGELSELLDHKKSYCKLRFTCKCQDVAFAASAKTTPPTSAKLLCAVCKDAFANPWDLMVHAQAAHMVNIYELGDEASNANNNCNNPAAVAVAAVENGHATIVAEEEVAAATKQTPPQMPVTPTLKNEPNNNNKISNNNSILDSSISGSSIVNNNDNNGHMSPSAAGNLMATGSAENGSASDMDTNCQLDIKFSPSASASPKEVGCLVDGVASGRAYVTLSLQDQHRDDLSLDGRLSSSSQQTHHSDELNVKLLNGSVSSRGSSPGLEADEPPATRACIVRTLSIDTSGPSGSTTASALSLISNGLGLALAPQ
ncbi:hypothetical protein KR038_005874 [Drosophila bunnanda]|nr:hypothetical protein KR038_005874 [Drosophila bunnanda]